MLKRTPIQFIGSFALCALLSVGVGMMQQPGNSQKQEKETGGSSSASVVEGERTANRLIQEKSPYLLQHAYNPVDWYPWGEEAFETARRTGKPIFLSVGYSTCHWCHVMERESFSNPQIAAVMNEHFVCIKVDREERPDVDQVYMAFVQAATGRGGWPMSVFLTPELKPFFGGTYFSPEGQDGRLGFKGLLLRIASEWDTNRKAILSSAGEILGQLREFNSSSESGDLERARDLLDRTYSWYEENFDSQEGGFGMAPKFPRPVNINFLLRYYAETGKQQALHMTALTLRKMAEGGMYDQIGGGFHRYSTDGRWFLPHFEKMLYDQAQLAVAYLEVYQITKDPLFARVARGIFDYVLRDMKGTGGGFYSAEDADSSISHEHPEEHAEGAFYVWTHQEISNLLGPDASVFIDYYGVEENGNVLADPFGEFEKKNVLNVSQTLEQIAEELGRSKDEIAAVLERGRQRMFQRRASRPRPGLDDKILTAWNGLMISALAKGYQILQEDIYLEAAEQAAEYVVENLYNSSTHQLKRRYRDGQAAVDGFVDDYALLIRGLLDLYESSLNGRWLLLALQLNETQSRLFGDSQNGGFYSTSGKDPSILLRMKEAYDGAEPSPNSVAVLNLLQLSEMTGQSQLRRMAEKSMRAFENRLSQSPSDMPQMMVALSFYLNKSKQILIVGKRNSPDTQAILREVHKRFIPNKIVLLADGGLVQQQLSKNLEVLDSLREIEGKATAYICEDYVCQLPTNEIGIVAALLEGTVHDP